MTESHVYVVFAAAAPIEGGVEAVFSTYEEAEAWLNERHKFIEQGGYWRGEGYDYDIEQWRVGPPGDLAVVEG